ncbi:MAG TPA: APC family permease, partial [Candidatus Polarisedimenticolia bacterium]|nr:APC family permease [Candidatus Polarisedimenticolia bacterium]
MSGVAPLRHLGRSALVAVGINSVVGGGIFILPASVAALVGPASLGAYVIAGTVALGVGWSLAALAARFDISGGPYLYVHHAFGGFAGFQAGWLFCLARLTAMASLLNGFARYLGALLPGGSGIEARALLVSLCAVAVVGSNVAGIRQTSGIANLLAIVKVVPLVLLGLAGLAFVRPESFAPAPFEPLPFVRAVLLLVFAFSGFEILTVPAEESLRPRRDMPYALLATILTVCVLYLMVHAVALGTLPGLRTEAAPLASVAGIMIGPPGRYAMTAVAALSTAGCALASLVGGTRMLYAMSRAAQIPAWIGALSVGRRTP